METLNDRSQIMRAARVENFGPPEVLEIVNVPIPVPGPGQVLVRPVATSLNASDITHRRGPGFLGPTARILGWDVAGVVEHVGVGVTVLRAGDHVFGMLPYPSGHGAAAEYVLAPVRALVPLPASLDMHSAAALPLAGLTAWQALVDTARVVPGKKVLIHGGAGGVGHLAIQIAKALGCFVTATARSSQQQFVAQMGADETVDFEVHDFTETSHRFDAVLDTVGGDYPERSARILASGGSIISLALRNTKAVEPGSLPAGGTHSLMLVEADHSGMQELSRLAASGRISPQIAARYPLNDIVEAHRHFEKGGAEGKIVITV